MIFHTYYCCSSNHLFLLDLIYLITFWRCSPHTVYSPDVDYSPISFWVHCQTSSCHFNIISRSQEPDSLSASGQQEPDNHLTSGHPPAPSAFHCIFFVHPHLSLFHYGFLSHLQHCDSMSYIWHIYLLNSIAFNFFGEYIFICAVSLSFFLLTFLVSILWTGCPSVIVCVTYLVLVLSFPLILFLKFDCFSFSYFVYHWFIVPISPSKMSSQSKHGKQLSKASSYNLKASSIPTAAPCTGQP